MIARARAHPSAAARLDLEWRRRRRLGQVLMLEIAERFAKEKPARSIIFISHQGEEGGLRGSRWFSHHPTVPLENIVAAHNMDMGLQGARDRGQYGGPSSVQMLGARLCRASSAMSLIPSTRCAPRSWRSTVRDVTRTRCGGLPSDQVTTSARTSRWSISRSGTRRTTTGTHEPQYIDYDHSAPARPRFVYDVMWALPSERSTDYCGHDPALSFLLKSFNVSG